ncbi:hypothetical protein DSO57_1028986 [Entomophthora muscae]|uniref:Uncharacterized protein n=1 Tax=Entomophthora muscae TaxID=34485 RepID=A0ACC2T1F0_9FUNG|nr:hypothetical protein DSO57_1028986 [Entomophthora muscae]
MLKTLNCHKFSTKKFASGKIQVKALRKDNQEKLRQERHSEVASSSTQTVNVRIDNFFSLETWAREQELNPKPGSLWAAGPVNCGTTCPRFSGIELSQVDTELINPCSKKRQSKEIIAPNGGLITAPNGVTDLETISFVNLKSTSATNQEPTQERGTGLRPSPMTPTLKLDDQAAKSRIQTNERTPGPSAILPPLDPSTQFPRPCPSQCPDEPPMENVKFGGGVLYRPKDPALQTYCHF